MANLLNLPKQHMENWEHALESKNPPWSTTPEYHQWASKDLTQQKSLELSQIPYVGNLAAGAFELAAPFIAGATSIPFYDIPQAIHNYNKEPGKYEVNNKWDKINAYFPGLEGTSVSGILNAIDMEDPLSAAWNRFLGASQPLYNRLMNKRETPYNIKQRNYLMNRRKQDMQQRIRQGEAKEELAAQKPVTTFHPSQGNVGPDTPSGLGKGQSPTGGDVAGTPFVRGGRANYFDGGLLSLWPR